MSKKYFSLASIFVLLLFFSCKATLGSQSSQSENIAVESISVSTSSGETNLSVGETLQLIVEVDPENASNKSVSFVSRKPSYASVSESGLVTAKKAGTVIIDVSSVSNSAISSSIKLTLEDSSSSESENQNGEDSSDTSQEKTLSEDLAVTSISSQAKYTGAIQVSWQDTDAEFYTVRVYADGVLDNSLTKYDISKGVQSALFTDLDFEKSYTFDIISTLDDETGLSEKTSALNVQTVIYKIESGFGTGRIMVQASNSDGSENQHIAALEESSEYYAGYWIVHPSLSGTDGYFSLEAALDSSGVGSGKYLCLSEDATYTEYNGAWSYGDHSSPYAVASFASELGFDLDKASFKWGTSSNNSEYFYMECEWNALRVSHNSLTYWGQSRTQEDSNGCGDFKIAETFYADTYSVDSSNSLLVSNIKSQIKYSKSIELTWSDTEATSYEVRVYADEVLLETQTVEKGVQKLHFTDLDLEKSYIFDIVTSDSNGEYVSKKTSALSPQIVSVKIASAYPNISEAASATRFLSWGESKKIERCYNTAALADSTTKTASWWIIWPSLSGTDDYFSLEAASTSQGSGYGYYLYVDNSSRTYTDYYGTWGSGYGTPYVMCASLSGSENSGTSFIQNTKLASFTWKTSDYNSNWNKLVCEYDNSFAEHSYLTYSSRASSNSEDSNGCGAFAIYSSESSSSYSEATLSDRSVIMATLSDFDVISSEALDSASVSDSSSVNEWTSSMTLSISDSSSVYSYKPDDIFSNAGLYNEASFTASDTSGDDAFEISDGTKYYAFSPERALISFSDSVLSSRVYAEQDYSLNNTDQSYVAASATSQENDIDFSLEPILSVIEIDLSDFTLEAQSVSIKSNSGVSIAGSFTYDIDSKTLTVNSSDSTTYSSSLQSDVVSVSNVGGASLVKAYILPVKLVGGITITVRDTDGNFYTKTTSSDIGNSSSEISLSGIVSSGAYVSSPTVTVCLPYSKRIAFGSEEASSVRKNNWQSTIPSNTWFSMLSTPGAHDSATSSVTDYTAYSKCQMLSISELLEAGVRAFDLRPGYMYKSEPTVDTLGIFHGQCSTSVLYKDAIATLVQFVIDNPTESITILQVKENSKPTITLSSYTDYSSTMWSIISEVLSQYSTYIINCDHSNFTLADLRGKIMMFNRNGTDCPPMIMLKNWPDNDSVTDYSVYTAGSAGGRMCASVEDCYNQTDTDEKLEVVETLLNLASSNTSSKYYHFTFNSIASTGITIKISTYVGTMNWNTSQYILNELSGASGYVYGDYMGYSEKSGAVILNAIIDQNFKYVYTSRSESDS